MMSREGRVVIVGGYERMAWRYRAICREYRCAAKVYAEPRNNLDELMGHPDLIVLFPNQMTHEMSKKAKKKAVDEAIPLVWLSCASCHSLRGVLSTFSG
jgi:hypothetical protein